jgi:Fur family peroxide stress response transcriptional regulator
MRPDQKRRRLQEFESLCRERGLAVTVQRRHIFELMLGRTDHPSADQVYDDVKRRLPSVSRTTVYRVLELLAEIGAIRKVSSPGPAIRFDPIAQRHHHLVCQRCGQLIDLPDDQVRHRIQLPIANSHSFEIQDFSIHFQGICAGCRRKAHSKRGARAQSGASRPGGKRRRKPPRAGR